MRPTTERRGGARHEVPNGREVTPTKLWTLAVLAAVLAFASRMISVTALRTILRF